MEAASCEVAALARSPNFPVMNRIVAPFLSSKYYDRSACWNLYILFLIGDHDNQETDIPEFTLPSQVHLSRLL